MAHVTDPAWKRCSCETHTSTKGEFSSLFLPSYGVGGLSNGVGKPAGIDDEFGRVRFSGVNTVLHTDFGRVDIDPFRDHIQLTLNCESGLGYAMTPHGSAHGFVRIHVVPFVHKIGNMIGYHEKKT